LRKNDAALKGDFVVITLENMQIALRGCNLWLIMHYGSA